jgi:transposase
MGGDRRTVFKVKFLSKKNMVLHGFAGKGVGQRVVLLYGVGMIKDQQIMEPSLTKEELNALLGGWEGYQLGTIGRVKPGDSSEGIWIELLPRADRVKLCSGCQQPAQAEHDREERWIRDLPIFETPVELLVQRCRVICRQCGPKLEHLAWLAPYQRVTRRLALSVARLCRILPIKHVAEYFDLHWETVKTIDQAHLEATLPPPNLSRLEVIAIDDFAIRKGHRFATLIVEPTRKEVLWIGVGRSVEQLRPFFERLGQEGCRRLQAAVMDMWEPYEVAVRQHCPQARIVYDLFHVASKYAREVIDRVRVDEANRLRSDKPARHVVKSTRWLLLRNAENISPSDRIRLNELLGANRALMIVYVLKDDLKHLWDFHDEGAAKEFWEQWYRRARRSRVEPLKKFALNLKEKLSGVLAHCRWPLHTSLLEGINNKIKVIKRMAYGFRDQDYFFLKIRQAFPGIP